MDNRKKTQARDKLAYYTTMKSGKDILNKLTRVTHEPGDDGVDRLHRIGAWYLGVR